MRLLFVLVLALAAPLLLGLLGSLHPALDSFSHFRVHLLVLIVFILAIAIFARNTKAAVLSTLVVFVSLALTYPNLPGFGSSSVTKAKGTIKVAQLNLFFANPAIHKAQNLLQNMDADFVLLQEVTKRTIGVLDALKPSHPYQHLCKYGRVAIASRHPFADGTKPECMKNAAVGLARFKMKGRTINLTTVHLSWPWPRGQHNQIDQLRADSSKFDAPAIVAGDFNAAPWSHTIERFAELSGTQPASGYLPTWAPRRLGNWRRLVGLPIDNILYSEEFELVSRYTLADAGSDHLPIITVLGWKH